MHVWVGQVNAIMVLDIARNEELYQPVAGSWYLLTACDCSDQTGQDVTAVREGRNPGFFLLVYGSETVCLFVCYCDAHLSSLSCGYEKETW